ncbi:alpha/beta fold hydrolase [Desulfurivibrio dismutans]|uniref:alpha/beta fold hydrolase n=1 Tax=Desulfurivibrio dismutans TaxID=1398908 RepID=UPI0023DA3135|nr:alpha/beta fold hydrolase [Desulfurivibrio alkaliphilus]MDF1614280.1 alpha/beta fold hydrolase [Desulfurivibrio alkaliphilus]
MRLDADKDLQPAVVLVHGIWMTGLEMGLLARRLRAGGFVCYRFPYSSLRRPPGYNADTLADFVGQLAPHHPVVHLLGHSLGGRIIELTLGRHLLPAPGRVLTLGTPFAGSHIARRLARQPWSKVLLGAAAPLLLTAVPRWQHQRPLGVIAGDQGLGIGLFFQGMPKPHDGTVALEETVIKGATARFTVHTAHLPMLFNREVAALAAAFLQTGAFITKPLKKRATVVEPAPGAATPCRRTSLFNLK